MSEIMNNGMNEIGSNGIKGNGTEEKKYRIEHDSIGEKEVPIDAYYGVQTLRAHENFYITGLKMHPELIKSVAQIKKAEARFLSSSPTSKLVIAAAFLIWATLLISSGCIFKPVI